MKRFLKVVILVLLAGLSGAEPLAARTFNDKVHNPPDADNRRWHLGFSIGAYDSDLRLTHNGYITPEG